MSIQIWIAPLTSRIYVGHVRHGHVIDKQDETARCINAAIAHLVHTGNLDVTVTPEDGKRFRVVIEEEQ
jgi:hypothetical protein